MKTDTLMQRIIHARRRYSPLTNSAIVDVRALSRLTDYYTALEKDNLTMKDDATGLKVSISSKDQLNKKLISIDNSIDKISQDFGRRDDIVKMKGDENVSKQTNVIEWPALDLNYNA